MRDKREPILEVKNVKKYFPVSAGVFKKPLQVKAVDDVSFTMYKGETLGLVGESGCGKSTLGRTIVRLYEPTDGEIIFKGNDISHLSSHKLKYLRQQMQLIFQDPYSSLNPRMNVNSIVGEAMLTHKMVKKGPEYEDRVVEIVEKCGLAAYHVNRYPHQFSGGQRQRIGVARALALNPEFIVADEPVSALDVSVQSQVLNMMNSLKDEFGLSYLFISHDLSVVKHISDRIGVMYLGSLVELTNKEALYEKPLHPYTKALLAAIPEPDPTKIKKMEAIKGEIPSNINTPSGCKFHTRCPYMKDICKEEVPEFRELEEDHFVACHFAGEI
ncbi:ABC transporter ATP-binding protein [Isachenkonia alkalipeptolytica]|uniref:ABC transporter ATP-binding protein n=1 Tax=Isachenkonia alkalipeptolytica TaxID=2565777 RepID=A0AA43XIY0_9CLOT|nr:ABC transporter ATP-binding protein [Isachenkonia alkalipeptolytica]NBG87442.1 ABC transporter ATP-binding protein [Isachenkonia alkalipeptolytica]